MSVTERIKFDILDSRIPEDWAGMELHWLLVDRLQERSYENRCAGRKKRYRNDKLVMNL